MATASPTLGSAASVLGWLATYLLHSTPWIAGAWLLARWVRSIAWREWLWRGALLGGFASASLVSSLGVASHAWRWESAETPTAAPSAASGPLRARAAEPAPPSPTAVIASDEDAERVRTIEKPALIQVAQLAQQDGPALSWSRIALGAWLLGALFGLALLIRQHARLRRMLASRRIVSQGPLLDRLDRLRRTAHWKRPVRLSTTSRLASPVALARGEIVVPEPAPARLSAPELDCLLAHELAHLRRRDPWTLLLASVLQRIFFLQPLNRLAARRALETAEMRCDELAARWTHGEVVLARCLAEVASWLTPEPAPRLLPGMAEHGSALVERVERLLAPRRVARFQGLLVGSWFAGSLTALTYAGRRLGPMGAAQEPVGQAGTKPPAQESGSGSVTPIKQELPPRLASLGYTQASGKKFELPCRV